MIKQTMPRSPTRHETVQAVTRTLAMKLSRPLLILLTTVAVAFHLHLAALMNSVNLNNDYEKPHQALRHSFVQKRQSPSAVDTPDEPLWWMEEEADDWFERMYVNDKKKFHALRDLSKLKSYYNPVCGHYRFNDTAMPDVSVIVTSQNEVSGWISTTVHSIIARTPPHLLKEVIVIDDNGVSPEIRDTEVNEKEYRDLVELPKVKVIQNHDTEGCARSRLIGAKAATGKVLMFVDSHIEQISSTWYQHLVLPILENPHTMAVQTIDIIDDTGSRNYSKVGYAFGLMNKDFYFEWQGGRFDGWGGKKEEASQREPYATPVGPGSLFAIRRDEFFRLGGYDEGLYVWGGENTELALKIWMCGGRVVMVPCSRVGHMFRKSPELMKKQWPPKISKILSEKLHCNFNDTTNKGWLNGSDFGKITQRNNIRVMEIWVGDHPAKYAYYKKQFGREKNLEPQWQQYIDELKHDPAALKQIRLKEENKCHDFGWYDKHVMMKLVGKHHPWYYNDTKAKIEATVNCGGHRAKSCNLCPQGSGKDWCNGECVWCEHNDKCMSQDEYAKKCIAQTFLKQPLKLRKGKKLPSRPLDKERRALISMAKAIDLKYVDMTDGFKTHPHKGARDEKGNWGYVYDETTLRRNPPSFEFDRLKEECKKRDGDYRMLTEKVFVDLEAHDKARGRQRARLFCLVKTSTKDHASIPYILQTWAPKCDGFMVASNETVPSIHTVNIPHEGPEEYNNLWQKTRSITSYVYDNYYDKYDWFYFCDVDTYVLVENLRLYLESEEIKVAANGGTYYPVGDETVQTPIYLGRRFAFNGNMNNIYPSGGAGYTLNKAALKALVVNGLPNYFPNNVTFADDWMLGRLFQKMGIFAYDTKDENGGERFNPFPPGHHYNYKSPADPKENWYERYSIDIKYGPDHCAARSISFHYVKDEMQQRLHALLYHMCPN